MTKENSSSEDLMSVNPDDVTDITKLRIDSSKSVEERRRQYLKQVGNPYLVRVGDTMGLSSKVCKFFFTPLSVA